MPSVDQNLPATQYGEASGPLNTGTTQNFCALHTPTSASYYGPSFVRAGDRADFIWTVSIPSIPAGGDCHRAILLECSNAISGSLTVNSNQVPLSSTTDSLFANPPVPVHSHIAAPTWWNFNVRYPGAPTDPFLQPSGIQTFQASFLIDPNATPTSFSSPSSDSGPWAMIQANNWGMAVPFNIGANGAMKLGEILRIAQQRDGTLPGNTNSSGYCNICPPHDYIGANSAEPPHSPGYGWNLGGVYARVIIETDPGDTAIPPTDFFDFYDGSGSFDRWTIGTGGTLTPYYSDMYTAAVKNGDNTYTLTFKNRSKMNFHAIDASVLSGLATSLVDPNGNTLTYAYDSSGRVVSVTDGEGRGQYMDYTGRSDGQPVTIYERDPALYPSSASRPRTMAYTSNRLSQTVDAEGNTVNYTYTAAGQLYQIIRVRNGVNITEKTLTYYTSGPSTGLVLTEQDYDQRLITYTYVTAADNSGTVTAVETDLVTTGTPTRTTVNTYDRRRRLVKSVDPNSNVWNYEYHDSQSPYLMTKSIDPNLNVTSWVYNLNGDITAEIDAFGNQTSYSYSTSFPNQISQIQLPSVGTTTYAPTQLTYQAGTGNLLTVVDALGKTTSYSYTGRTDGRVTSITDRNNNVTTFTYTDRAVDTGTNTGNLKTITFQTGSAVQSLTFTYDLYDNVLTAKDALNNTVDYSWDKLNRLKQVLNPAGDVTVWNYVSDLLDNIVLPPNQASGVNTRKTVFLHDAPGRVTEVDSQINSNPTSNTQMRAAYVFDGWNRLTKLRRTQTTGFNDTNYQYDVLDRLTSTSDPLAHVTSTSYQPFCISNTQTTPRGVTRTSNFDALCRLVSLQTPGELDTVAYDSLGRVTSITQSSGSGSQYGTAHYGSGRYQSAGTYQTKTFAYDDLSRVVTITFLPENMTINYTHDFEGNILTVTDVNGVVSTYTYTPDNRLKTVTVNSQVFTYNYDVAGRLYEIIYPASTNIVANFHDATTPTPVSGWDANGRLKLLRYTLSGALVKSFAYTYDSAGNRVTCVEANSGGTTASWTYGYDWLNRLISASDSVSGLSTSYTYDKSDNRLTMVRGATTYTFNYDAADQLTSRNSDTFTYDLDGNLLSKTQSGVTTQYLWDDKNHLTRITTSIAGVLQQNSFDASGLRKSTDPNIKYYNSGSTPISDVVGATNTSYIQGHQLLGKQVAGVNTYYLSDGLGSIRVVVNSSGATQATMDFDEFGNPLAATAQTFTYIGGLGVRNETSLSGLYLMGQRFYDPQLGRWLSRDPIGFAGGLNQHAYVGNNSINRVDPSGLADLGERIRKPKSTPEANAIIQKLISDYTEGVFWTLTAIEGGLWIRGVASYYGMQRFASRPCSTARMSGSSGPGHPGPAPAGGPVTPDVIRAALKGSTMRTMQPAVSGPAVERYVRRLESGEIPPAIQVDNDIIVEGNHRYAAGRVFGQEPVQSPGTAAPSQAAGAYPISEIKVDPFDWGNK